MHPTVKIVGNTIGGLSNKCCKLRNKLTFKFSKCITTGVSRKFGKQFTGKYTVDILKKQYNIHKSYVFNRKSSSDSLKINFRLPNFPEDISENIIKFILHKKGDTSSNWNCKNGDLFSDIEGKQECKSFTSHGPSSFSPSSEWDTLYILDAMDWLNDKFILYRINLSSSSDQWRNIRINKNDTFGDMCKKKIRPRIVWSKLYPQISGYCEKIFDGHISDIL